MGYQLDEKKGQEIGAPAQPYSHLCRRSGRSPALPYPPHRYCYSITFNQADLEKNRLISDSKLYFG